MPAIEYLTVVMLSSLVAAITNYRSGFKKAVPKPGFLAGDRLESPKQLSTVKDRIQRCRVTHPPTRIVMQLSQRTAGPSAAARCVMLWKNLALWALAS